jgi:Rieske Fe-S protein
VQPFAAQCAEQQKVRRPMSDRRPACADACACQKKPSGTRRNLLTGVLAIALAPFSPAIAQANARMVKPKPDDLLVFADGVRKGEPVSVADIVEGEHPKFAYPMDPATRTVRDGSRINLVLLVKLKTGDLSEKTRPRAADGVVAYSAVCTHYGCQITVTHPDGHAVICNCHGSTFDTGNNGEIVVGPATRRLASLPLKAVDGALVVAAGFSGQLGPPQQ